VSAPIADPTSSRPPPELQAIVADVACTLAVAVADRQCAVITEALGRTGAFVGADRAYLISFDWVRGTSSNTHEWCAEGIAPQMEFLAELPLMAFPYFMARLPHGAVAIDRVSEMPEEAAAERAILEAQAIQSILTVPVTNSSGLAGFVGFDAVRTSRQWSQHETQLLGVLATIMGSIMERQRVFDDLNDHRRRLRAALEAIPDLVFTVSRDGQLRFSKATPRVDLLVAPEDAEGRRIHELFEPTLADQLQAAVVRAIESRQVVSLQYPLELPVGLQHFEARFAAHTDDEVTVIVRNVTEHTLARRTMEDHRSRLHLLAEQQAAAEQALRQRVAAEVHDGLAQELAMARLLLGKALQAPGRDHATLSLIGEVLDGAVRHVNELTVEISPPSLRELGLPAALREAGRRLAERHQLEFELELVGPYERLSTNHEAVLYWAARELLVNVVKHARASLVHVLLEAAETHVRVVITDDGCGLPPAPSGPRRGFGLFNARERLRLAGGDLTVRSQDVGTQAAIELPRVGA
jgi:signal transduction histidine kinase